MSRRRLDSFVAPGVLVAAALFVFQAVAQLTTTPSGDTSVHGTIEYLQIASITVALIVMAPVMVAIGRRAGAPRATGVALVGMGALAALCVSSGINGGDFGIFPFVAIPANLMWFGAFIALGVILFRGGVVERRYAFALPLVWVALLPFSWAGGGIVAAALWLAVARRLDLLQGAQRAIPATA